MPSLSIAQSKQCKVPLATVILVLTIIIVNLAFHFRMSSHVATVPAALQWCTQNKDEENLFGYSLSIVQFDYKMVASHAHYN